MESYQKMDQNIPATGSTAKNILMASKSSKMATSMKATGSKIVTMVPVLTFGVMAKNIQELGLMTRCMALENSKKGMEKFIPVIS